MRICHILEAAGGGSAQVVIDLLKAGAAAGEDVTLIYSPLRAEPRFLAELESLRGIIHIYTLPMRRSVGLHDLLHVWRLAYLLKKTGPFDVINSHSSKAGALGRLAGLIGSRAAHIYTPHAFVTMAPESTWFYRVMERLLSHFCDAIICGTTQEKDHAAYILRINEKKLHIIYNGVSLHYPANRKQARKIMEFDDSHFVIGFTGRLVEQKNPLRMLRVFAAAAEHNEQLRLVILGDGHLKDEMNLFIAQHQLTDKVHMLSGFNARDLMPGFDTVLCSSDYESFLLVLIEALAAGLPVACTPVGVAAEPIAKSKALRVSSSFSDETLLAALLKVIEQHAKDKTHLSRIALEMASKFSIENTVNNTHALYRKLTRQKH